MENNEIEKVETKHYPVESKENGELLPRTLESQFRLAKYYKVAGLLPYQFDSSEKVLMLMQYCYENNLKVVSSSRQLMVINNNISMFGDLPLALVRKSGELKSFREYYLDKDGNEITVKDKTEVYSAVCFAERITGETCEEMFSIDDAIQAQLYGKKGDIWKKYEKVMLRYRARSRNLKTLFADVLLGLSIAEYDYNIKPDVMTQEEIRDQNAEITLERRPKTFIDTESLKEKCLQAEEIFVDGSHPVESIELKTIVTQSEPTVKVSEGFSEHAEQFAVDQQQMILGNLSEEAKKEILEEEKNDGK